MLRDQFHRLWKAEWVKKLRKERGVKRAQFIKDPYRFTKALLGEPRSGTLTSTKAEVEEFLWAAHGTLTETEIQVAIQGSAM